MPGNADAKFVVLRDPDTLARVAADWILARVLDAAGLPAVCLAGGSTPQLLYRKLTEPPYHDRFPWPRVHWFWGDERFVPHDSPRSNYRMVCRALFDHAPVPAANIHAMDMAGSLEYAAENYEGHLRTFYGSELLSPDRPLFSATLLGLGTDGHTASLFPGDPVLDEKSRWVVAVPASQSEPRVTLTFPVLESSGGIAFLVSGAEKCAVLARIRRGGDAPAARIQSPSGVNWFVDRAAAEAS